MTPLPTAVYDRRYGANVYDLNGDGSTSQEGLRRLILEVVDASGARSQFDRVVRLRPRAAPAVVYSRVVDGGSGFIAQDDFPLIVGTPYTGQFDVTIRFAAASVTSS